MAKVEPYRMRVSDRSGWRIRWRYGERQYVLTLGPVSQDTAVRFATLIDRMVEARRFGLPYPEDVIQWAERMEPKIRRKLQRSGWLPAEPKKVPLSEVCKRWLEKPCKPSSLHVRQVVVEDLLEVFGRHAAITDITPQSAEALAQWYRDRGLADSTCSYKLTLAKSVFRMAVQMGLMDRNPFDTLKIPRARPTNHRVYVPASTIEAILPHCPDWVWRLLLVLARYAGLRTPSEPFSLRWSDVLWDEGRLLVDSPKTGLRAVPLFPRVRQALEEAFELSSPGADLIIPDEYRRKIEKPGRWYTLNLRTGLKWIVRRAGFEPWPRPWHNLRASCETDLVKQYPLPVVAKWLGNSSIIAYRHYVDVTDEHFKLAAENGFARVASPTGGDNASVCEASRCGGD